VAVPHSTFAHACVPMHETWQGMSAGHLRSEHRAVAVHAIVHVVPSKTPFASVHAFSFTGSSGGFAASSVGGLGGAASAVSVVLEADALVSFGGGVPSAAFASAGGGASICFKSGASMHAHTAPVVMIETSTKTIPEPRIMNALFHVRAPAQRDRLPRLAAAIAAWSRNATFTRVRQRFSSGSVCGDCDEPPWILFASSLVVASCKKKNDGGGGTVSSERLREPCPGR
jgi:hypothetical protein